MTNSELEQDCLKVLKARDCKITSLYSHQLTAIRELLSGNSVVQRVQTGGGKTLVIILMVLLQTDYPNKYKSRKFLVFSPTLALIQDTKRRFKAYGISCWTSRSEETVQTCSFSLSSASSCAISELDMDLSSEFLQFDVILSTVEFWISRSSKAQSARWAFAEVVDKVIWIDEADTAIITSKTYRPAQKELSQMPTTFAPSPFLFSSATWTETLLEEGRQFYNIPDAKLVATPADRKNLHVMRLAATTMAEAKEILYEHISVSLDLLHDIDVSEAQLTYLNCVICLRISWVTYQNSQKSAKTRLSFLFGLTTT